LYKKAVKTAENKYVYNYISYAGIVKDIKLFFNEKAKYAELFYKCKI